MRRALVLLALAAAATVTLAACSTGPAELSLKQREVGDALTACLNRELADVSVSSVGPAAAGTVLGGGASGVEALMRQPVGTDLEGAAWARDGKVVVALGVTKEMVPATTPRGVKALSNQSAMIWEATGSLPAVGGCFGELAR